MADQIVFGVGSLFLVPSGATPTPQPVGIIRDVSVEIASTPVELRGAYRFALDVADGPVSVTGSGTFSGLSSGLLSAALGGTSATGNLIGVLDEAGAIPGSVAYTITVTNSATWVHDLGVWFVTTGERLARVASAPAAGQYSVAAGVYTFNSADASKNVKISYSYSVSGSAKTTSLKQSLTGQAVKYELHLFNAYNAQTTYLRVHAAIITKVGIAFKNDAHMEQTFDFAAFANSTASDANVLTYYTAT